ncbi:hypothetical protein MKW94_011277 [Papaver nudicaule]|uniref:Uncharacterized protein n=1 Tax=Papaver nudicaule TaxID=74823 RepID=A0AA41VGA9_PAPNU|nr:hypothetical protein [Papaver nudicaule]
MGKGFINITFFAALLIITIMICSADVTTGISWDDVGKYFKGASDEVSKALDGAEVAKGIRAIRAGTGA